MKPRPVLSSCTRKFRNILFSLPKKSNSCIQKTVVQLVDGRLGLLDAEYIRVKCFYRIEKAFFCNCADTVYIPTN